MTTICRRELASRVALDQALDDQEGHGRGRDSCFCPINGGCYAKQKLPLARGEASTVLPDAEFFALAEREEPSPHKNKIVIEQTVSGAAQADLLRLNLGA
jgi:hypothetical protein